MTLDKFFLKYEEGVKLTPPPRPPGKTTLKKPSLIRVNGLLEVLGCCTDEPLAICIFSWFGICTASATSSRTNFLINDSIKLLKSKIKKCHMKLITFTILFIINTPTAKYLLTHFEKIWIYNYTCWKKRLNSHYSSVSLNVIHHYFHYFITKAFS